MAPKLGIGDPFPAMRLQSVEGAPVDLPAGIDARYRIVLFYRAYW